jgi:hypothetical protein
MYFRLNIMNFRIFPVLVTVLILTLSYSANAEVRRIISPNFNPNRLETEYYGSKEPIDGSDSKLRHLFGLGYGLSSWLQAKIEAQLSENADETPDHINGVARIQFWQKDSMPIDLGLRTVYEWAREKNSPDKFRAVLAGSGNIRQVVTTVNYGYSINTEKVTGVKREGLTDLAIQAKYPLGYDVYAGAEYYTDLGKPGRMNFENQLLGPVIEARLISDLTVAAGIFAGLSGDAPDATARWEIRYAF